TGTSSARSGPRDILKQRTPRGGAMPQLRIVLVAPKIEGNIGAVARAMRNFDVTDLVLVRPCAVGEEARRRAMHGASVLAAAQTVAELTAAVTDADLVVGTSGIETESEKKFARIAMSPRDLAARVSSLDGIVALVFGREDFGLLDDELHVCDLLVTVPASRDYPILNLSHAATVVLYEMFTSQSNRKRPRKASALEKEKLHDAFEALLDATTYPPHKRTRTKVMFRRLVGRAVPSKWEFHALMGVFQRATQRIRRLEGKP
ncbi:MAG: RNA methyltransferase, partial [Methanobacteriota archaeon]